MTQGDKIPECPNGHKTLRGSPQRALQQELTGQAPKLITRRLPLERFAAR